ncbi:MAG TPA: universal stress protein [Trebonia sp.]|nr:universal stress protein [Trebonia sp.]
MTASKQRIVVGVDGSESSKAALRWAIRQAKLTDARVDAVMAWRYPSAYGLAAMAGSEVDLEGSARKDLIEILNEVSALEPDVPVQPMVTEGHAAEVLVRAASGADLLVVGSRGHGAFTSTMIGSVSINCVLHARCPVLVLRDVRNDQADHDPA